MSRFLDPHTLFHSRKMALMEQQVSLLLSKVQIMSDSVAALTAEVAATVASEQAAVQRLNDLEAAVVALQTAPNQMQAIDALVTQLTAQRAATDAAVAADTVPAPAAPSTPAS